MNESLNGDIVKNPHIERLRRKMREFHRHHPWRLEDGFYIPHAYPENDAKPLSWWDDVGFILNGRRVLVFWQHPRFVYSNAIAELARGRVTRPDCPSILDKILSAPDASAKQWRKLGRARKRLIGTSIPAPSEKWSEFYAEVRRQEQILMREGIPLTVKPSMKVGWSATARTVELIAPLEVCSIRDARALAEVVRRLLKQETTVAQEWSECGYDHKAWLSEADLRKRAA